MNQHLSRFLKYLATEKNRVPQTVANYDFYLSRFLNWANISDPKKIDVTLIKNYHLWLARRTDHFGRPLKKSTQNYHLIALRSFLKFLKKNNLAGINFTGVKLNRTSNHLSRSLLPTELEDLLAAPLKTDESKNVQLRDKALLEILFSTGAKVSALSGLKKQDIDLDAGTISAAAEKIKHKLSNQGKYYLKLYLNQRRDGSPFIFIREDKAKSNKTTGSLTPRSIQRVIKNYAKNCGIKTKVTPQIIRQTVLRRQFIN